MQHLYSTCFSAMGSDCHLHIYAGNQAAANVIFEQSVQEIARIESRYSRYQKDSFLTEVNHVASMGASIVVDTETAGLIDYAYGCYRKSGGLFDITSGILRRIWDFSVPGLPRQTDIDRLLPLIGMEKLYWDSPLLSFPLPGMELDFGGIGKEYAADQAAAVCRSLGIEHGLIDLGGDIVAIGPHPDQKPWRIGIRHPKTPHTTMIMVDIDRGALATSGDYERYIEVDGKRYCHLLNPKTGWPAQGLSSVSVFADQCLVAGSLSSIAMLKGIAGIDWLDRMGVQHIWMSSQGRLNSSC